MNVQTHSDTHLLETGILLTASQAHGLL